MKTLYIEKKDKPKLALPRIKIEHDNCEISFELEKQKNIKKVLNKLRKKEIQNVVLSKDLYENKGLINALNANNINIFDGRWLEKYLSIQIMDYIVTQKGIKKEESEIAMTVNHITDLSIEIIKRIWFYSLYSCYLTIFGYFKQIRHFFATFFNFSLSRILFIAYTFI